MRVFIGLLVLLFSKAAIAEDGKLEYSFSNKDAKEFFTGKNAESSKSDDKKDSEKTEEKENTVRLKIGGMAYGEYRYLNEKDVYEGTVLPNGQFYSPTLKDQPFLTEQQSIGSRFRLDLNPEFENKASGIKAGALVALPINLATGRIDDADPRAVSQEYIYVDTKYSRFELGSTFSAASKMRVDPQKISSGTGGVYGVWWRYASYPVFNTSGLGTTDAGALNGMSPVFMIYPTLPNEAGFTMQRFTTGAITSSNYVNGEMLYRNNGQAYPLQGARSNKVALYTKRYYGLQFGFSYSPTTEHNGFATNMSNSYSSIIGGFATNLINFGVNYKQQFDDFGIAASITQEFANMQSMHYQYNGGTDDISGTAYLKRQDICATAYGLQMTYKNFGFAYSYNDWYKSLSNRVSVLDVGAYQNGTGNAHSYSHTVGFGWNYGPATAAIHYMYSNYTGNVINAISIGTDIKLLAIKSLSVQPYVELTQFWMRPDSIYFKIGDGSLYHALNNSGQVFIMGVKVNF